MNSIKSILLTLFTLLALIPAKAQQIEVGMLFGTSQYLGDLSDEKINFSNTYFATSLFGRYNFNNRWAVKGYGGYGRVSGDDKQSSEAASKLRNLNFYSDIFEFSVHFEYNLLKNNIKRISARPMIPYLFAGVGVFNFNPKTDFAGRIVELQPLATEGQGSTTYNSLLKYNLTEICIPMGVGFRARISDAFYLGFESGIRFTSTNYLDDVGGVYGSRDVVKGATGSEAALLADRSWEVDRRWENNPVPTPVGVFKEGDKRSNKSLFSNDIYFMSGITITYIIRGKGPDCPKFN